MWVWLEPRNCILLCAHTRVQLMNYGTMENLPDLVKAALSSACNSGKILSWKVQESEKGTPIQLVWKPRLERQDRNSALGFNWNSRNSMQFNQYESESNRILVSRKRKRMTPSRARRNVASLSGTQKHECSTGN